MMGLGHVIAVIEDDASVRGALQRLFRTRGFQVSLFTTAEDYLADPGRADVDCLVTDVRLPGIDGLELLEKVRAENSSKVASVVITAHDDERVRERAVAAGANGFFLKPFDNDQLQDAVVKALSTKVKDFASSHLAPQDESRSEKTLQ